MLDVKKEVKRESGGGAWGAAAGSSSRSHHSSSKSSSMKSDPTKHSTVKLEPSSSNMAAATFGLPSTSLSKKTTPSPTKQSKQRSLFSPPAESASNPPSFVKTEPRTRTTSSSSSASATSPSVKLSKLEQMP